MNDLELNEDKRIKVKSLYKSMQLLALFDQAHPERGITELAELSGMLKSSVHNIVSTFEACNVLARNPVSGKYQLASKVLEYAYAYSITNTIDVVMKPLMDQLADEIGETVLLAIPDHGKVVYSRSSVPRSQMETFRHVRGVTAAMYCTGIGKAMLAYLPQEVFDEVAAKPMPAFTANTITTKQALAQELEQIRRQGYSVDNMEHEFGIKCVAVPLFNTKGKLVGAVSITGPSPRFSKQKVEEYSQKLLQIAQLAKPKLS